MKNLHLTILTATNKLNSQGTRSEEESVPRQDGAGRACHGWRLLRLSDLTVFPEQAQCHSETVQPFFNAKTRLATGFCFISSSYSASSAAVESASIRWRLIRRPSRQWPPIPQHPLQ